MVSRLGAVASSFCCTALLLAGTAAAGQYTTTFAAALARADAEYARRAFGAHGAVALAEPVEAAIAGYRRALSQRPESTEARWRLLRALFFRATFCGSGADERQRLFEEARPIADEGVARLERAVAGRNGAERITALREIHDSGELLSWAAVTWGEWALGRSRWSAARAGAPGRIRDLAQAVIDVDPELEEGGGYRVLGRLHDRSPKLPFVSGFVSRDKALACLRQAYAAFPENAVNQVFLAEAILRHDPAHRDAARELLARRAGAEPRARYRVEDAHYAALARRLLEAMQ